MAITKSVFGKSPAGQEITLYTMTNSKGMQAAVTDLGAILVKWMVPDKAGNVADVVLGFDRAEDYYGNPSFFGAVIGPSANRIAGASFEIDGATCQLDVNDGLNNLHSHMELGYHKQLWAAETIETENGDTSVVFSLKDSATMGFPGNKEIQMIYTLTEANELILKYHATSDKKCVFNPTNHTYFNLDGAGNGNIENHELWMGASSYTPVVSGAIPTGEIAPVQGTPMDFTEFKVIGKEINADFEQLKLTGGYDHNWVIDGWDESLRHIATVKGPESGREMKVFTTLPGVQFYAGNFVDEQTGKGGALYGKRSGLCLETQYYPDSIHHENFPSSVFGGEEGADDSRVYDSVTVYQFV